MSEIRTSLTSKFWNRDWLRKMNVSPDILRRETVQLIRQIDTQIKEVEKEAERFGVSPEKLRDGNGTWPMTHLLLAKAQAYNTLVLLQTK